MKHRFLGVSAALLFVSMSPGWAVRSSQYVRLPADTVLKARLNQTVSSASNRAGDSFTATVRDSSLPEGTVARGVILGANKSGGDKPGRIGLDFRTLVLPNGRQIPISGSPIALNSKDVKVASNGHLVATSHSKNNTGKYVAIGAAGGLLVGSLLGKNVVGGLLGAGAG
ncbi:MAG: hypothetical protein ACJ786_12385, partial [Catenulispora sp.]